MSAPLVTDLLETLNRQALNKLALAGRQLQHPGASGASREQIIRDFLRMVVPTQFGIDTGFVIDATGKRSKQIDIVIFRRDYHPVFEIGGVKHFMVESVGAVIENKASIPSADSLVQALENVQSVKALDRTNRGRNYVLVAHNRGGDLNPADFHHQVFGVILTEESLKRDFLAQALLDFLHTTPRNEWLNMYADIRHLSVSYLRTVDPTIGTVIPAEANFLAISEVGQTGIRSPLVDVAKEINNFLRVTPLVDYSPNDYMPQTLGEVKWWRI